MTVPNVTDAPAAPSQVLRVAIVDDDPFVLQALRAYLSSDERIEVTSTFSRAADALAFLHKIRVDVLLTDVRMPEMDGLELLTRVRRQWPRTAVVVLTSFDDDEAMVAALAQHANGFLLKDASPEEIIRAVIAASAGGTTISPAATSRLVHPPPALPADGPGPRRHRGRAGGPHPPVRATPMPRSPSSSSSPSPRSRPTSPTS